MTKSSFRLPSRFRLLLSCLVAGAAPLTLSSSAFGRGGGVVEYDPVLKPLEGVIPFQAGYTLKVRSPLELPMGSWTVTFAPKVNSAPANVDPSVALGYLIFSDPQLTFTTAGQWQSVTVTLDVPEDAVVGSYKYQIYTSGWPGFPADFGAAVNASVTRAPATAEPAVVISIPEQDAIHVVPGTTTFPIELPFNFTATSPAEFPIASIAAEMVSAPGASVAIDSGSVTGLYTTAVSASGMMTIPSVGTYSVLARATNGIGTGEDQHAFTVTMDEPNPPTVTIESPLSGSTFYAPWTVAFSFRGTSTSSYITKLQATLDGAPLTAVTNGLNTLVAVGTTTLPFQFGGEHVLIVTAVDATSVSATATSNFTIDGKPPPSSSNAQLRGVVFLDVNGDGDRDTDEVGLPGITVKIAPPAVNNVSIDDTPASGEFSFDVVPGTTYLVEVEAPTGFISTNSQIASASASAGEVKSVGDFGLKLDFDALRSMTGDGLSQGYWKENVTKTYSGKTNGTQGEDVDRLTADIRPLALSRFSDLSLKSAIETFNGRDQLLIQLLAGEYNFVSGRFVGGSLPLTYAFISWGEYVEEHSTSPAEREDAKNWFDAFNNSHGGFLFSGRKK